MQNYLNFANVDGICFNVVALERDPECLICGQQTAQTYTFSEKNTLGQFMEELQNKL